MNNVYSTKKQIIIFGLLLFILFIILSAINVFTKKKERAPVQSPVLIITPTQMPTKNETLPSDESGILLPTYPPEKGAGVDLENAKVASSILEIEKLYNYLPFAYTFKSTTNKEVSIVIPGKESQVNNWTLTVNIYDLDYEVKKGDIEYDSMKNTFRETAKYITDWIAAKGIDNNKILFNWGEQEYIQNKSKEWLNN